MYRCRQYPDQKWLLASTAGRCWNANAKDFAGTYPPEVCANMSDTTPTSRPALGICLEEYEYPYPVQFLPVTNDLQSLKMAYMDIPPGQEPNGKTVVLFH
jgi:hypothetical protein